MISPTYQLSTRKICETLLKNACHRSFQDSAVSPLVVLETAAGDPCQTRAKDEAPSTITPETRQKGAVIGVSPYGVRKVPSAAMRRVHMMAPTTVSRYVERWLPR